MNGLVVEEFQKTNHILVAECSRRAQLLTLRLFGADGSDQRFEYYPGLGTEAVLASASDIANLRDELQPRRLGRPSTWRMASASAPNKKRSKPDDRRPIVDRSRWPTNSIDVPVARALDWISNDLLPAHLHTDIQRVDAFIHNVAVFNRAGPALGTGGKVGGDVASCFSSIKHTMVLAACFFFRKCLVSVGPCVSTPKRHRKGRVRPGPVPRYQQSLYVMLYASDIDSVIKHHLRSGWLSLGGRIGRGIDGLPMGSTLAGALTRMTLIFYDIVHRANVPRYLRSPNRISTLTIDGYTIAVMDIRYVDDCMSLWRGPPDIPFRAAQSISDFLRQRMAARYPLKIEDDLSDKFVGVTVVVSDICIFETTPSLVPAAAPYHAPDYPAFMAYRSFTSPTIKRAIVFNIVSRVASFTVPEAKRPEVLNIFLKRIVEEGGFPLGRVRAWIGQAGRGAHGALVLEGLVTPGFVRRVVRGRRVWATLLSYTWRV